MFAISIGSQFFEILKYTIPALIVFITCYFIIRQFFRNQSELQLIKQRAEMGEANKSLKLQAFERLMLYCDRMDVYNMAMRLRTTEMTCEELMQAMLISMQKEYEHNVAQQLYVSETLWKVISQAKSSTTQLISSAYDQVVPSANAADLLRSINTKMNELNINPAEQAKRALRSEAETILSI